jgi:hypothetical protein
LHVVPLWYITAFDRHFPTKNKNMIWPTALSTFLLNRVCELVTEEKARVQFFRNHDLKDIVQASLKFTGHEVGGSNLEPSEELESKVGSGMQAKTPEEGALGGEHISYNDG